MSEASHFLAQTAEWLQEISDEDAMVLAAHPEFRNFELLVRRLQRHHSLGPSDLFTSDVGFRVLGFLESPDLVRLSGLSRRWRRLVREYAASVVPPPIPLLALRGHELTHGARIEYHFVPLTTTLLPRRIRVTEAGDDVYNGLYCNSGCNGNGYRFTKSGRGNTLCIIEKRFSGTVRALATN